MKVGVIKIWHVRKGRVHDKIRQFFVKAARARHGSLCAGTAMLWDLRLLVREAPKVKSLCGIVIGERFACSKMTCAEPRSGPWSFDSARARLVSLSVATTALWDLCLYLLERAKLYFLQQMVFGMISLCSKIPCGGTGIPPPFWNLALWREFRTFDAFIEPVVATTTLCWVYLFFLFASYGTVFGEKVLRSVDNQQKQQDAETFSYVRLKTNDNYKSYNRVYSTLERVY